MSIFLEIFYRMGIIFSILVLGTSSLLGSTLSGKILEKGSKNPIVGASLLLEPAGNSMTVFEATGNTVEAGGNSLNPTTSVSSIPSTTSITTDADLHGYYKVNLTDGTYRFTVVASGFEKIVLPSLEIHQNISKDIYLQKTGFTLPEIVVYSKKGSKTELSRENISKEELTHVAGTYGDAIRAMESLPGVSVAEDKSAQLIVRGAGPLDNLYYLDRIPTAFPFHLDGLISTVNPDLIKSVEFSAGGFGPEYGNAWGGLMDVTQVDGRRDRWGGSLKTDIFLTEGLVEGPITSNSSLFLAGRRSYLDVLGGLGYFNDYTVIPTIGDYQAKFSYDYSPQTHWDFQAFGSSDHEAVKSLSGFSGEDQRYGFDNQGLNYRRICDDQNIILETPYHYTFNYNNQNSFGNYNHYFEDFGNRFDWIHSFDKDTQLQVGTQLDFLTIKESDYFYSNNSVVTPVASVNPTESIPTTNWGLYFDQKFKILSWIHFSLGARWDSISYSQQTSLSPRFSLGLLLTDRTTVKASFGYYYQSLQLDPFSQNLSPPALARSMVLGVEQKFGDELFLKVEGYNKDLSGLSVSNFNSGSNSYYSTDTGKGYARGVEIFLRRALSDRFFGWISYALSDTRRQFEGGQEYVVDNYDRPQMASIVANYKITPRWEAGLTWKFSSGLPYTPFLKVNNPAFNGSYDIVYGQTNSAHLPDYHRLDLSTSFTTVYDTWEWRIFFQLINAYDHPNVLYYVYNYDYSQKEGVLDFPLFPFIGFEVKY